uniref:EGF-like domain-containing protein n=1 Tax=Magallana gigas TaxID=29159 RepID=A0A8W8LMR2_MAGGI
MRGFQCLLFCVLLYSASVEVFGQLECEEDGDCPDNATCEDVEGEDLCVCGADFDAVDVPGLTIGGTAVTVCIARIPYTRMTTTSTSTTGTTKKSGIGPIIPLIGGGALLLALLAGGAAALASSSG